MNDYSGMSDWDLQTWLQNPLGPAAALSPGQPTPKAPALAETKERKSQIRDEFRRRGYSDAEIELIEQGDFETISRHRREHQEDTPD